MKTLTPDLQKVEAFQASFPENQPILMINLLRFKEQAEYEEEDISATGKQAYETYIQGVKHCLKKIGASIFWVGDVKSVFIAPPDEDWDLALLVRYPSFESLASMSQSEDYLKLVKHRTAALDDFRLMLTVDTQI